MTKLQEVQDRYYHEVGTFIDLVCQRKISCTKIILVGTKADEGKTQPTADILDAVLERVKGHLSYIFSPDSPPVVVLFDPSIFLFDCWFYQIKRG